MKLPTKGFARYHLGLLATSRFVAPATMDGLFSLCEALLHWTCIWISPLPGSMGMCLSSLATGQNSGNGSDAGMREHHASLHLTFRSKLHNRPHPKALCNETFVDEDGRSAAVRCREVYLFQERSQHCRSCGPTKIPM